MFLRCHGVPVRPSQVKNARPEPEILLDGRPPVGSAPERNLQVLRRGFGRCLRDLAQGSGRKSEQAFGRGGDPSGWDRHANGFAATLNPFARQSPICSTSELSVWSGIARSTVADTCRRTDGYIGIYIM